LKSLGHLPVLSKFLQDNAMIEKDEVVVIGFFKVKW
jgi:hypothetical protein